MAKVTLSKATFENLVKHLVEVEEGKNKLVEQYFPEPSKERNEFVKLIEDYIKQIDQLIRNVNKSQTAGGQVPFVTIGSEVEVQDLDTQEVLKFCIVNPFHNSIGERDVSYISPVGKSLLLKKVGDEVEVNAPGGVFRYKIKSIQLRGG
ncbi:Transcription elongation factor GreA [Neomoorella glycerini]|uniref:Transcription elongation factor GreA n=1 Tax=Neomoorella glycerini TaxID=55779 RepID=A0A6I5ZRJ2_9FIRM|nr:GreA/GreB family elongation factor [Moorella glycerini]QGP92215.1 Transcription elongation factor GreA [Moorella glycerini]